MALGGWLHVFGRLQSMFILYIYRPQSLNSTITKRRKEFDDVSSKADLFFTEVLEVLHQISDRVKDDASKKADEPRKLIAELEFMLQKEIKEFESIDVITRCLLAWTRKNMSWVLGIIDFMRQYTWDKHLETWVKASGILGEPKNASHNNFSKAIQEGFRKAMPAYFLMVPDQWLSSMIPPSSGSPQ